MTNGTRDRLPLRILSATGTTMVAALLAASLLLGGVIAVDRARSVRLDVLVPAELVGVVVAGAVLTLVTVFVAPRATLAVAILSVGAAGALAVTVLFAQLVDAGGVAPGRGWVPGFAIVGLVLFVAAISGLFLTGIALCRFTFDDAPERARGRRG